MKIRSLLVAAFVAAAGITVTVVSAAPAQAVQTDEFGLKPAGDTPRAKIELPANGARVQDAVIVYNRMDHPITVDLQLVGVSSPRTGQYGIGDSPTSTSDRITLPATSVTLAAGQQANVPLRISTPRGTTAAQWAAVTATAQDVNAGGLTVRQRLAVIIGFTPTSTLVPLHDSGLGWWWLLIVALIIATITGVRNWRNRRRDRQERRAQRGGRHGAAGRRSAGGGRRRRGEPAMARTAAT